MNGWRRLHPATPMLRGGIAFTAIAGYLVVNLLQSMAERVLQIGWLGWIDGFSFGWLDPAAERLGGQLLWAAIAIALALLAWAGYLALAWRARSYRLGTETIELRWGVLFRSHRQARLDRVQAVDIARPLLPRLFGLARIDVSVAGEHASVRLEFLRASECAQLRADILAGVRTAKAEPLTPPSTLSEHVREATQADVEPNAETALTIPTDRVLAAALASGASISTLIAGLAALVSMVLGQPGYAIGFGAAAFILGRQVWRALDEGMRFSLSDTPDGLRVVSGLLTSTSTSVPVGRVHAAQLRQGLLWRRFGWFELRIVLAGMGEGSKAEARLLPVGTWPEVQRVLSELWPLEPDAVQHGIGPSAETDGFSHNAARSAWLHPLAWRRIGWRINADTVLVRTGWIDRRLTLVPLARVQSVALQVDPAARVLGLARVRLHSVPGPFAGTLPASDLRVANALFHRVERESIQCAQKERA